MKFQDVVEKRASIKKYSDKKPAIKQVIECIRAANLAPSPGNLLILKYIIVEDYEKILKISEACRQPFIAKADFLVVVCSESKKVKIMYDKRAKNYIKQHAGAAIENFLLKITDLGLASSWVSSFSDASLKNTLQIPEEVEIEAILPVAYQSKIDKTTQKRKSDLENIIYFETYKNKYKKPIKKI